MKKRKIPPLPMFLVGYTWGVITAIAVWNHWTALYVVSLTASVIVSFVLGIRGNWE